MRVVANQSTGGIIDVDWIIRSIPLASTFDEENPDEWFVNDLLDGDLLFRLMPLTIADSIL
jgi:hypothetical protein